MIDLEQRGNVAILHMAHGKANVMDVEFCRGIKEQLEELRTSSSLALVLIGQGKIFSAGVDLVRILDGGVKYLETYLPALNAAFETLFFYPKPVVAAVNGHAIAGGCIITCAADHRMMARDTGQIGVPELRVGVPFPTIALEIMRFALAPRHFQSLIYSGETFPPDEAKELGFVDEIVEPQDLLDRAVAKAEKLISTHPQAFSLTKSQIRQPVLERVRRERTRFDPEVRDFWATQEALEAMRRYVSRTFKKPKE